MPNTLSYVAQANTRRVVRFATSFPAYRSFTLEAGLYLVEPKGGRTYQARARIDGKWKHVGTDTADYRAAEQFARKWFRQLHAGRDGHETLTQAADAFLKSIRDEGTRDYHTTKWEAVKEFFSPGFNRPAVLVTEVTTPKLLEFVKWRQARSTNGRSPNATITASTIRKDLVTLRQILKFAVARAVIAAVPMFPGTHIIGSVDANPQPWLDPQEWKHLMDVAAKRINDASDVRTRKRRQELHDFLLFMHGTGLRVDEAYSLQVRDVTIAHKPVGKWISIDGTPWVDMTHKEKGKPKRGEKWREVVPYLKIRVRESKTGVRLCNSRAGLPAEAFRRLAKEKAPTAPLFTERHRDALRELLIAADLRTNAHGHPRNAKALRPTSISHWLIDRPTIPLKWLADNCGTSIKMLEDFYLKRLRLDQDGSAWL